MSEPAHDEGVQTVTPDQAERISDALFTATISLKRAKLLAERYGGLNSLLSEIDVSASLAERLHDRFSLSITSLTQKGGETHG